MGFSYLNYKERHEGFDLCLRVRSFTCKSVADDRTPSSCQFPSPDYNAKPETYERLLEPIMHYLGHVGDPHVMVLQAALLVASKGDVGCGAAHSVSAPRASPLA